MKIINKIKDSIFRYRLPSICFIAGQLVIYITIFGALQIYNNALLKEEERKQAIYKNRIKVEISSFAKKDVYTGLADFVKSGNIILAGRFSVPVRENTRAGSLSRAEVIIRSNETLHYPVKSGCIPGENESDYGHSLVATGINWYNRAYEKDGKKYLTICGKEYEISGVIGGSSDYWDNNIVFNIKCMEDDVKKEIQAMSSTEIYIESNSESIDTLKSEYEKIYKYMVNVDGELQASAIVDKSYGKTTTQVTYARQKIEINYIVYIFCLVNSMLVSYFWIEARKKEIAIRKAFGIGNVKISIMLFTDILKIMMFSLVLFFIIYGIGYYWISNVIKIYINVATVLRLAAVILLSSVVTVIYPVLRIMRMVPSQGIAGGDD